MSRLYGTAFQNGYLCDDLDSAMRYWVEQLGIGPWYELVGITFDELTYHGKVVTEGKMISRVAIAYSGDMQMELIVPGDAPSTYHEFLGRGHKGLHHVGLFCDDYDAQLAAAIASGWKPVTTGSAPLVRFAYLESDPDRPGTVMELVERSDAIREMMEPVRLAAIGWDGRDPYRQLG